MGKQLQSHSPLSQTSPRGWDVRRGGPIERFEIGDAVWNAAWDKLSVVRDYIENDKYELNYTELSRGWENWELQAVVVSFGGPVRMKKWRRNGHGGR